MSTDAFFFGWKYCNKKIPVVHEWNPDLQLVTLNLQAAIYSFSLYIFICAVLKYILIPRVFHPLG